eukprot:3564976-Amphidinium_carterae.1
MQEQSAFLQQLRAGRVTVSLMALLSWRKWLLPLPIASANNPHLSKNTGLNRNPSNSCKEGTKRIKHNFKTGRNRYA